MNQISDVDLSYLAGVVDCDGSIIAQFVYHKDYNKKNPYEIRLTVQVSQLTKRKWFLTEIREKLGEGVVRDRQTSEKNEGCGYLTGVPPLGGTPTMSDFVLVGPRPVSQFLKMLTPFLKLKKKQANLVIRICEQLANSHDPDIYNQTLDLVDQVASLNDSKNRTITAQVVRDRINQGLD
jgi:hypothetical protein